MASARPLRSLPGRAAGGPAFFLARAVNGALALLQAYLCLRLAGDRAAAAFFLAWTAAWLLAAMLKFGVDGVLPRAVAEARLAGKSPESMRRLLAAGAGVALLAFLPLAGILGLPIAASTLPWVALLALCWAGTLVLATLLRSHQRVALGGALAYVAWPAATVAAPAVLLIAGSNGRHLLALTAVFGAVATAVAVAAAARALGAAEVGGLVGAKRTPAPLDRDACGAALVTWLYELLVWLPVVLAAVTNSSAVVTGAAFAATRLVGVLSWGYQAVVATLTPRIASAIASGDLARTARLTRRGSVLGLAVTAPPCIACAVLARPAMGLFDSRYETLASILVWLALGRVADAAAGPVGEALLVGRRAFLDALLTGASLLVGGSLAAALEPSAGPVAIGVGAAAAFALANLLRWIAVRALLRRGWRSVGVALPTSMPARAAWLVLGGAAVAAGAVLATGSGSWLALALVFAAAVAAAACVIWLAAGAHGLRTAATAPPLLMALVLLGHFALRPAVIALDPQAAAPGLRVLGFGHQDIAKAAAIGVIGLAALAAGFQLAWRRSPARRTGRLSLSLRGLAAAAVLGSFLWALLFARLGGPAALLKNPAALHLGQFGGGYATVGLGMCFGAALLALDGWLTDGGRPLAVMMAIAAGLGALGSVCLATRGPLVASVIAGIALVVRRRPPTRRALAYGAVGAAVMVALLGFGRAVREYGQVEPLSAAVRTAATTSPHRTATADLIEFDHFVALTRVVPSPLGRLNGDSLAQVPAAFVPRVLWPGKPLPLDFLLSRTLYGPGTATGTPFTLPGEAFWNVGTVWAPLALLLLGVVLGLGWGLLEARSDPLSGVVSALTFGYGYLLLTRPLAAMTLGLAMALIGLLAAAAVAGSWSPRELAGRALWRLRRTVRPSQPFETGQPR
jgi:O-antigen/teichoic acid export membrane protein